MTAFEHFGHRTDLENLSIDQPTQTPFERFKNGTQYVSESYERYHHTEKFQLDPEFVAEVENALSILKQEMGLTFEHTLEFDQVVLFPRGGFSLRMRKFETHKLLNETGSRGYLQLGVGKRRVRD